MRNFFLVLLSMILSTPLLAQQVEWASKVLDYSSQFSVRQYAANQVLGKPNVLPNLGASPNAWSPKRKNRLEYVKVGFEKPMKIRQVAIAETYNPGGIEKIYAYDVSGKEYLLNTFETKHIPIEGRLFRFVFDETPYEVAALKLVINGKVINGYFGIDAIGISDSADPISIEINITDEINNDYVPVALDSNINTPYNELRPLISPDAKTLYFSRRNSPENIGGVNDDEDIWYAERDSVNGSWKKAKNIGRPLNNKGPNFISSISVDNEGTLVLLGNAYYSKNRMTVGVSRSYLKADGTWARPENLTIKNDYNYSDKANYCLSGDKKVMLMAVEREDSYGDRDLYVSFQRRDGTWSKPLNMGDVVNTADEEGSPFLARDGKTLFFSSKGFSGFGGFDIYLTRRLDDTWTNWSEPENLGSSFNSKEDDIFFNFTENDEYAYFTRGTTDNTDIYRVKLPYYHRPQSLAAMPAFQGPEIIVGVRGKVFDSKTLKTVDASIEFIQESDKEVRELASSDSTGYKIILPHEFKYKILCRAEGYYNANDSVSLMGITVSKEIVKDIYMDPIVKNKAIVFDNLYFEFDSDKLKSKSFPALDEVVEMLLDNPDIHISVNGHTCSLGSDAYNQRLSEKRARAVTAYLEKHGVDKSRLEYHGYGESRPIASNDTEAGREINRRVEFKLTDAVVADK